MNSLRSLAGLLGWTAITSGLIGDEGDRPQVALLEASVLRGGHVGGEARGGGQQRVAVRRGAGHGLGRDVAAGAAAVLHHEALLEAVVELGRNQPPDDVGEAAGREGDDHGDVLRRIGLRRAHGCASAGRDDARRKRAAQLRNSNMAISLDCCARTLVRADRERSMRRVAQRSSLGAPAPTAPARSAWRRSPASPAGRSRARCRSPAAWRRARRGNPRRSDSARRSGAAVSAIACLEAAALLGRVGELAEAVGELDAAGIELEALRQRADRRRRCASAASGSGYWSSSVGRADAELRLDPLDQHAAEDVGPGVVVGDLDAGRARRRSERVAVAARRPCSVASRSMPANCCERLGDGEPLAARHRDRRCGPSSADCRQPAAFAASTRIAAQSSISAS